MDRDTFGRLVEEHLPKVIAIAASYSRNAAEDIAQVTFLKAWQSLHRLQDEEKFTGWIRVIARNTARNWLRDHPPSKELGETAAPAADSLEELVETLPEELREVIRLRYSGGLAYQEIAETLEVPLSAVKDRLFRAKRRLRGG